MLGYTAQELAASLHIPLAAFGPIFSAGLVGLLVGAILAGRLADRIGRRRTLIICTLAFSFLTVLTPLAHSAIELISFRFIAGLGLGGAMPSFLTLVSEYAPRQPQGFCRRPAVVRLSGRRHDRRAAWIAAYPALRLAGHVLHRRRGWRGRMRALQALFIPESLQFLALRGSSRERILAIAAKILPERDFRRARFTADATTGSKPSVRDVFAEGRMGQTLLLWLPLFLTFWTTTFFVNWAPTLFKASGMPAAAAALMVALNNFATLPSQATTGYLIDRVGPFRVLPITYALLALSIVGLGLATPQVPWVALCMLLSGFLMGPGIAGMVYLATAIYPSKIRSTGTGLAMGVGRSGQVFSSLAIGGLVGAGLPAQRIIMLMCAPSLIAIGCVILLGMRLRSLRPAGEAPYSGARITL